MRRLALSLIAAAAVFAARGARADAVLGAGTSTCRQWTAAEADNILRVVEMFAWIEGYVSSAVQQKHIDFHKEADVAGIKLWIDAYCQGRPDDSLSIVADKLAATIAAAPPAPPMK